MMYAAFYSYVLLASITPGPNNILSMSNGSKYGLKRAFPFNIGMLMGSTTLMALCAVFTSLLYGVIPSIKPYMLCVGAAYILWLAWTVWRDKPHKERRLFEKTNTVTAGFALQFVNVKGILYGVTAMSSFVLPYNHTVGSVALYAVILATIGFASTCCWLVLGAAFEGLFKRHGKILNAVMALLLVYCAVTMLLEVRFI